MQGKSLAAALSVALIAVAPTAATALPTGSSDTTPASASGDVLNTNPDYLVLYPEDGLEEGGATFYPTGELDEDTVVVIADADGSLPGDISEAQLQSMLSSRSPAAVSAALGIQGATENGQAPLAARTSDITPYAAHTWTAGVSWSGAFTGGSIWGYDSSAKVSYVFNVTPGTNQKAAGQGLGYYSGYNGSEFGMWAKWYGVGIASDGSAGGATVPWGKVIATAQFKGKSMAPPQGANGQFSP
ncbi:hypothetical protein [Oerskovia merdavium]|uniref:Uncharacterized protein n=1 Tax=Oerskovia merdavium TaxID=2762227 RepID=A0ABR8U413_9CELL|nr:hypothetical protein [Oerskovia merdavium]MBD7982773.1 hypothetical protein [Oerskovia merdavium]